MRQQSFKWWETTTTFLLFYTSYYFISRTVVIQQHGSRRHGCHGVVVYGQPSPSPLLLLEKEEEGEEEKEDGNQSSHMIPTITIDKTQQEPTPRPTISISQSPPSSSSWNYEEVVDDGDIIHLDSDDNVVVVVDDDEDASPKLNHDNDSHIDDDDDDDSVNPTSTTTTNNTTTTNTANNNTIHTNHTASTATSNNNNNDTTTTIMDVADVIVVTFVDGTLVGLSKRNGRTLWKRTPSLSTTTATTTTTVPPVHHSNTVPPSSSLYTHPLVKPLVSTTTTIGSSSSSSNANTQHQQQQQQQQPPFRNTLAVPSILDGKVYLTSTLEDCSRHHRHIDHMNHKYTSNNKNINSNINNIEYDDDDDDTNHIHTNHNRVCDLVEDTVTTTIHNLMIRTPFVDMKNHGRIYTSQRHSVAVAIHSTTGIPIRTITTSSSSTSSSTSTSSTKPKEEEPPTTATTTSTYHHQDDPIMAIRDTELLDETTNPPTTGTENHIDDILWLGRTDYTISVHEPTTGELDVQFTMAEMISIHDMLLLEDHHHPPNTDNQQEQEQQQQQILRQYLLPNRSDPNTPRNKNHNEKDITNRAVSSSFSSSSPRTEYGMIVTPNGHVAYRHLYTGQIMWVASEAFFNTPAVYAFDAKSGHSIRVDIVPDVISPHGTMEYVSTELQKQLYQHHHSSGNNPYHDAAMTLNEPVFGALPGTGQIYAIPLLQKVTTATTSATTNGGSGYLHQPQQQYDSTSMTKANTIPDAARAYVSGTHDTNMNQYAQQQQSLYCQPNSPHYPRCLNYNNNIHYGGFGPDRYHPNNNNHHHHHQFQNRPFRNKFPNALSDVSSFSYPNHDDDDDDEMEDGVSNGGAIVPFYHPDYGYQYIPPNHFYTINTEWNEQYRRKKRYKKFMRIITAWFLPTVVAALFVTSFELGRRKKFKNEKDSDSNLVSTDRQLTENTNDVGIIQVNEEIILGHGGHGTVVYKGMLEGRQVAVKRLLKTYNASADREISLLIESDGHPNVVRYHLKETRGDFVYLALELCDLSLHDLIGHIRSKLDRIETDDFDEKEKIFNATKSVLLQITKGAEHLHRLRIVHRDLKPANILLASRKSQKHTNDSTSSSTVYETFAHGDYIAKISDMGLGKQLAGQSSYGGSLLNESSLRGESNGAQSSFIGIGPGSVGWQAPEVMRLRMPSDLSVKSDEVLSGNSNDTGSDFSPMDIMSNNRTSRSVDIFSLGCIFYSSLIPGSHPFGEWYEREGNIMHDRPNLSAIESLSLEAHDLISLMLCRDPLGRPTANQIGEHPFFWPSDRRLGLLCDLSDRLEQDAINTNGSDDVSFQTMLLAIEKNALKVVGTSWDRLLDPELINNVQRFRSYDPSSIRDLLRLIRNKFHHFDELPDTFKESIGCKPEGLSQYFSEKFPRLFLHAFHFCQSMYTSEDILSVKYAIPAPKISARTRVGSTTNKISSTHNKLATSICTIIHESDSMINAFEGDGVKPIISTCSDPPLVDEICSNAPSDGVGSPECISDDGASDSVISILAENVSPTDDEDIIIWAGSTSAKAFQCRGWNRSDDEWHQQSDLISRRRDVNLVRCAEDPKFRTRLCNHWDESLGTFCPMRKKNKCIFAHGPIELRVKEAKRKRWGKLVDENGDCNNSKHSGGEDTYGAARSIENERKQEGKWSAKAANGTKGKSVAPAKKKSPTPTLD